MHLSHHDDANTIAFTQPNFKSAHNIDKYVKIQQEVYTIVIVNGSTVATTVNEYRRCYRNGDATDEDSLSRLLLVGVA